MDECIVALEEAFKLLAAGDALQPLRWPMWLPDRSGLLGMMAGYLGGDVGMMGIKTVSVMPGNHGTEYDSHQGTVMLFEKVNGVLKAIVDASEITAIRTAAASAVATKLLANPQASNLAILGSGVQARSHLAAMLAVRPIQRIRTWSRNADNITQFATWAKREHAVTVEPMPSAADALADADIICTTTAAPTPILASDQIAPGAHINAVGSSIKSTREIDSATMASARLFVDWRESTLNEAGDFLFPKAEGVLDDDHILADLGELLTDQHPGRVNEAEVTLFKSLGLAIEDIAAAHHVYEKGLSQSVGTFVEIGGLKQQ